MEEAVQEAGLPQRAVAAWRDPVAPGRSGERALVLGAAVASGSAHHLRARAAVTGLVLSHRLRARLSPGQQAGIRDQAARVLGLTARLWLG